MSNETKQLVNRLIELDEKEVSLRSIMFHEQLTLFKQHIRNTNKGINYLELKNNIMNKYNFFNSRKVSNFLDVLHENGYVIFASYSEINKLVGQKININLWDCQIYVGCVESHNVIIVHEFGEGRGKKCLVYFNPDIIREMK